jgi:hypothetical protein
MLRVLVELSNHVIVFYNELITLMNAAGPLWQLIRKERYDQIKDVLIRIRGREAVSHIRRDYPQCYKWSSFYALVNDGESGFIVVVHPKDVAGFEPLQEDADIDTVLRLSFLEKAYADIKHHHSTDHCKGNTLLLVLVRVSTTSVEFAPSSSPIPAPSASSVKRAFGLREASSPS